MNCNYCKKYGTLIKLSNRSIYCIGCISKIPVNILTKSSYDKENDTMLLTQLLLTTDNLKNKEQLGIQYYCGGYVAKDYKKSLQILCYLDTNMANYYLGMMYYYAKSMDKPNYYKAFQYFIKSTHVDAVYHMGKLCYSGKIFDKDINRAIIYFKRAGKLGHSEAQTKLAKIYHYHFHNVKKATKWYKKAIEQQNHKAEFHYKILCNDQYIDKN